MLAGKLRLPEAVVDGFLGLLKSEAQLIESRKTPSIAIKDADDIAILACALAANADVFVTGDQALLDLRAVDGLPIVSPRQLWSQLSGLEKRK